MSSWTHKPEKRAANKQQRAREEALMRRVIRALMGHLTCVGCEEQYIRENAVALRSPQPDRYCCRFCFKKWNPKP